MANNQVNGTANAGAHTGSAPEYYTLVTQVNITPGAFGTASQNALNKIVEVVSQRAQPIILGAVTADNSSPVNYTIHFMIEHVGIWTATDLVNAIVAAQAPGMGFLTNNTTVSVSASY